MNSSKKTSTAGWPEVNRREILFTSAAAFAFASRGRSQAASSRAFEISGNRRFVVDKDGKPFLLQGDAAWSLIAGLTREDAEFYLENRSAKGFNTILVNLIEHQFAKDAPSNAYGQAPFRNRNDWTTPNEKYFAHADWVIRRAAKNGLTVLLAPVYLGYPGTEEGFIREVLANGPERLLRYGRFLGERYKDFDNIIWVMGGDRDPAGAREDVDAIALGIREHDERHLFTAHCHPDSVPAEQYPGPWLDLGNTYTYQIVHSRLLADYNRKPVRPTFLIETTYEGEHNASELQIRRQAYWAVLCGGFGHVMGNLPVWRFGAGWKSALDLPGSQAMEHWGKLFRSRRWFDLVPDQRHTLVTSGLGEFNGLDYLAAASTPDGRLVMAYMPSERTFTVDLGYMPAGKVRAWWFNPRNGTQVSPSEISAKGVRAFTPPAAGDWVFVLDDGSGAYPA